MDNFEQRLTQDLNARGLDRLGNFGDIHFLEDIKGFTPDPIASFIKESECLAMLKKWSKRERRGQLQDVLGSESGFHGDKPIGSVRWRRLYQEMSVGSEPQSVRCCKRVSSEAFRGCPGTMANKEFCTLVLSQLDL